MQTNNTQFEEQAKAILYLRHPRYFRAAFEKDQDFWTIYVYATAIAFVGDERIGRSIKYMYTIEPETHERVKQYGENDQENIEEFFRAFEDGIRREISEYECKDRKLLDMLEKGKDYL